MRLIPTYPEYQKGRLIVVFDVAQKVRWPNLGKERRTQLVCD